MNVAVMGTGHVGLITGVAFASFGHRVVGTDVDAAKIELLERGVTPFYEVGLEQALATEMSAGRLRFTVSPEEALSDADVIFICVGTPARANGEANLLAMEGCAQAIARFAPDGVVVVEKSTVPAGTAERLRSALTRQRPDFDVHVASNPEFLRKGSALRDALEPERIVIGVESGFARDVLRLLYRPMTDRGFQQIETDIRTAELAKHASNAFLAMKISYANAMARVCELAGADVVAVADIMGSDPRIGRAFLDAGLGYGGYCFPKDVAALRKLSARLGYDFSLLSEVERVNDETVDAVVAAIEDAMWNLEGKRIAILGLAFKPGTDDVSFSPAIELARRLIERGASGVGYAPQANGTAAEVLPDLELAEDAYEACDGAHCAVAATEWGEFRALDLERLRATMAFAYIVDARNTLDPRRVRLAGFAYRSMGRPVIAEVHHDSMNGRVTSVVSDAVRVG
jgi:UDPglucose 6-dehydrogenase